MAKVSYSEDFWDCRDYGHAWKLRSAALVNARPLVYEREFECLRGCGTKRVEQVSAGFPTSRSYSYAPEFRVVGMNHKQRMSFKGDIRMANLKKQVSVTTTKGG